MAWWNPFSKSARKPPLSPAGTVPPLDAIWEHLTATPQDLAQTRYNRPRHQTEMVLRAAGYVHICCALRAVYAASVPIRLMSRVRRGGPVPKHARKMAGRRLAFLRNPVLGKAAQHADTLDDVYEVQSAAVLDLLQRPNPQETGVEFRRLDSFLEDLAGNSYWLGIKPFAAARFPVALRLLYPQHTTVLPAADDEADNIVRGYGYGRSDANRAEFAPQDVLHFKHLPSAVTPYYGSSPLHGITTEADTAAAAAMYELNLLNNNQRPDFAVVLQPGSGEDQEKIVDAFFERRMRGVSKVGKPLIGQNFKIEPISYTNRDMQFVERNKAAIKAITDAYGMCGMLDEQTGTIQIGAGGQDAKEQRFNRQTILPKVAAKCEAMTEGLLPWFGMTPGDFWFAPDNPNPDDDKLIIDSNVALCGAGIRTIDEARAELGDPPLPDGLGAVPRYQGQPLSLTATPAGGGFLPLMLPGMGSGWQPMGLPGPNAATPLMLPGDTGTPLGLPATKHVCGPDCDHPRIVKQSRLWLEDFGHVRKDRTESPFATAEQMRDLIRRVQAWVQSISPDVNGEQVTFDEAAVMAAFAETAAKPIADVFVSGWVSGAGQVGPAGDDLTRADGRTSAQRYADAYVLQLARPVTQSVRERMNEVLRGAVDSGTSYRDAASMVRDVMTGDAYYIADRIARTELANTYQMGNIAAWKESGAVVGKRFQLAAGACPLCQEVGRMLAGKVVPLDQPMLPRGTFISAGNRTMTIDFRDVMTGTIHPNDRCSIEPVMSGEAE